ncbi:MAG: hypothetical protein A2Z34_10485 [Planctomycetes bacterium RBG_16_59_8]|nr:MAG: hypothetical protein A2Z34_10485 [Planctomycetes bacterium RBG_16_59_8]
MVGRNGWFASAFLVGTAMILNACGGSGDAEVKAAYNTFKETMRSGDLEALKKCSAGDQRKELDAPDAKTQLQLKRATLPFDEKIATLVVDGDKATVTLEGTMSVLGEKKKAVGAVELIKEEGAWKVCKLAWQAEGT